MAIFKDGGSPGDEARSKRFGVPTAGELNLLVFQASKAGVELESRAFLLDPRVLADPRALSELSGVFRSWGETGLGGSQGQGVAMRVYTLDSWESESWARARACVERLGAIALPAVESLGLAPRERLDQSRSSWVAAASALLEAREIEACDSRLSVPQAPRAPKRM